MASGSNDDRHSAGAVWESPDGWRVIVVSTPEGFVLASWPPERGMFSQVLAHGEWMFPDRHALAEALDQWRYVGIVDEQEFAGR